MVVASDVRIAFGVPSLSDEWQCFFRSGKGPGFPYGEKCMFVANDWHASLVPVYLAAKYRR
jgi:hypothetical protein